MKFSLETLQSASPISRLQTVSIQSSLKTKPLLSKKCWLQRAFLVVSAPKLKTCNATHGQTGGCPEQYGVQTYPHPEACDHYYLCVNGTLTLEQCGNGLLFDGKGAVHEHCNYHWAVDCGHRKADLVPISSDGCEFQFGLYPASASCSTQYVKCAHGVPHLEPCEVGLAYDERIHGCNWPDQLLEKCNPEGVIGFKCPSSVDPHSLQAKFWPYPRFAVPGSPDRLITCVDGHPRINTCGDGKLFDESSLTCLEPEETHGKYNNL